MLPQKNLYCDKLNHDKSNKWYNGEGKLVASSISIEFNHSWDNFPQVMDVLFTLGYIYSTPKL